MSGLIPAPPEMRDDASTGAEDPRRFGGIARLYGEAGRARLAAARVAREKAGAGLLQVVGQSGAVVLGADTEVILDGRIYGKPADAADAAAMLRSACHSLRGACAMIGANLLAAALRDLELASNAAADIDGLHTQGQRLDLELKALVADLDEALKASAAPASAPQGEAAGV